jgi:hypothetical protein
MHPDLTPIVGSAITLCAIALTTVGAWALKRLPTHLGVQTNTVAMQSLDEALTRAIQSGAAAAQEVIKVHGWDHPEVKSQVLASALDYAAANCGPALKAAGINLADWAGTESYLHGELERLFPTAMAPIVYSPVTPPATADHEAPADSSSAIAACSCRSLSREPLLKIRRMRPLALTISMISACFTSKSGLTRSASGLAISTGDVLSPSPAVR